MICTKVSRFKEAIKHPTLPSHSQGKQPTEHITKNLSDFRESYQRTPSDQTLSWLQVLLSFAAFTHQQQSALSLHDDKGELTSPALGRLHLMHKATHVQTAEK